MLATLLKFVGNEVVATTANGVEYSGLLSFDGQLEFTVNDSRPLCFDAWQVTDHLIEDGGLFLEIDIVVTKELV